MQRIRFKNLFGLLVWLTAVSALWFFENNAGTAAVLLASVLLPLVSVLCAWMSAEKITVALDVPVEQQEGQPFSIVCKQHAPWMLAGCTFGCSVRVVNRMTGETLEVPVPKESRVNLTALHAGLHEISIVYAAVSDWFGVIQHPVPVNSVYEMMVHPVLYPVEIHLTERTAPQRETGANVRYGSGEPETIGAREYLPGDPVRMIHWKLTEKLDKVMIRQNGTPQDAQILLALESHTLSQADDMHRCVKAFLSTSHALRLIGLPFQAAFFTPDSELLLLTVVSAEDEQTLQQRILRTVFTGNGESIGRVLAERYPDLLPAHMALFSPDGQTDAVSLSHGQPLTLVLPERTENSAAPEIRIQCLSESQPFLEL